MLDGHDVTNMDLGGRRHLCRLQHQRGEDADN